MGIFVYHIKIQFAVIKAKAKAKVYVEVEGCIKLKLIVNPSIEFGFLQIECSWAKSRLGSGKSSTHHQGQMQIKAKFGFWVDGVKSKNSLLRQPS